MNHLTVRFYAELNDFLPTSRRRVEFQHGFQGAPAVKDLIESLGVPHTEVDVILVDGESVAFSHRVRGGERISVYPVFESLDISPILRLRPEPLRNPRFVLDVHLGKLAAYLRLAGFDSFYSNDSQDEELAKRSSQERRILLTKDRGLLKRGEITHGYLVREIHPREQLREVLRRFDLGGSVQPFRRCMRCNAAIEVVAKEAVYNQLPLETREHYEEFRQCSGCGRVYWKGPHYRRMMRLLESVLGHEAGEANSNHGRA